MMPFSQVKRLDAPPLLEELVQKNPRDAEVLVALAASLIDHSAPPDQDAPAKERFRARDLVQKAWQLGNTSPLAEKPAAAFARAARERRGEVLSDL